MAQTAITLRAMISSRGLNLRSRSFPHAADVRILLVKKTHFTFSVELLVRQLKAYAAAAAHQNSTPVTLERALETVQLQLARYTKRSFDADERGHYLRREDIKKIFDQAPQADIQPHELFQRSVENAKLEADKLCSSEVAKMNYIAKYSNVVGVYGQPGIGKTTFTKLLVRQLLKGQIFDEITFLFFIFVKNVNFQQTMNLLQFLVSTCLPSWQHDTASDTRLLNVLHNDPNVVIIFDGLDEASVGSISQRCPSCTLHGSSTADVFICNLLGGNLLPLAKKLVTSRPKQIFDLNVDHRPHLLVEVLGLGEAARIDIGRQICGDKLPEVQSFLRDHPSISAYCYVPVNCILTYVYLSKHVTAEVSLTSMTDVLMSSYSDYVRSEHLRGQECATRKLATLAWNGFLKRKYVFDHHDLATSGIDQATSAAFLSMSVTNSVNVKMSILEIDRRSYFSHLIWQEFFAAVMFMAFLPAVEFQKYLASFSDPAWEVVAKFVFGLCNEQIVSKLNLPPTCMDEWRQKNTMLKTFAVTFISKLSDKETIRLIQVALIFLGDDHCYGEFSKNKD